jgi:hypothetical protein
MQLPIEGFYSGLEGRQPPLILLKALSVHGQIQQQKKMKERYQYLEWDIKCLLVAVNRGACGCS